MTTSPKLPTERERARDLLRVGWGSGSRLLDDEESRWLLDRAAPGEMAVDAALRLAGIRYDWRGTAGWEARGKRITAELGRLDRRAAVTVCVECGVQPAEVDGRCRGCSVCVAGARA